MSVQVSYKKQLIVGILILITLITCFEIVLRINEFKVINFRDCENFSYDAFSNYDSITKKGICTDSKKTSWTYSPTSTLTPNQHLQTININSEGLRGSEISKVHPKNTYRIILIGGSTTFGQGSSADNTTISGFLQKKYDEEYPNMTIQVINGGMFGADSRTEIYNIENKFLQYTPDLLIIYDGWNDASHVWSPIGLDIFPPSQYNLIDNSYFPFFRTFLFFYNHYKQTMTNDQDISQLILLWKDRWQKICELGKKEGFDTIITVQPIVGTGEKILTPAELNILESTRLAPAKTSNIHKVLDGLAKNLPNLKSSCAEVGDLRTVFDNVRDTIYYDQGHTGDLGNEIISQKLFDLSLPIVLDKTK